MHQVAGGVRQNCLLLRHYSIVDTIWMAWQLKECLSQEFRAPVVSADSSHLSYLGARPRKYAHVSFRTWPNPFRSSTVSSPLRGEGEVEGRGTRGNVINFAKRGTKTCCLGAARSSPSRAALQIGSFGEPLVCPRRNCLLGYLEPPLRGGTVLDCPRMNFTGRRRQGPSSQGGSRTSGGIGEQLPGLATPAILCTGWP